MYIAMEYCAAGSIDHVMQTSKRPLDEDAICMVLACIMQALAWMHELGVAHRDVKAGNILLTHQGLPRLADFGAAVELDDRFPTSCDVIGSAYVLTAAVLCVRACTCATSACLSHGGWLKLRTHVRRSGTGCRLR